MSPAVGWRKHKCIQVISVGVKQFDIFKLASLWIFEIKRRDPVVTVIALDHGSSAFGVHKIFASRTEAEVAATENGVDMSRDLPWADNRVHSTFGELLVREAKNSKGSFVLGRKPGTNKSRSSGYCVKLHDVVGVVVTDDILKGTQIQKGKSSCLGLQRQGMCASVVCFTVLPEHQKERELRYQVRE